MSLCDHCIKGVRHEGIPEGEVEVIAGVKVYVATPPGDYARDKALLFLPDVFGIELINAQLLADDFARNGFKVYAIDYFKEDALPSDAFQSGFNVAEWLLRHNEEATRPRINKVVAALKDQGVAQFAATGYCFGARYAFDLAFDGVVKVVAVAHPSFLKVPDDLEKFKKTGIPLLINSCEVDQQFPIPSQEAADKILGGGERSTELYQREYFAGCTHGFAVRGDLSIAEVKAGKEGAFKATVGFFSKHLQVPLC